MPSIKEKERGERYHSTAKINLICDSVLAEGVKFLPKIHALDKKMSTTKLSFLFQKDDILRKKVV